MLAIPARTSPFSSADPLPRVSSRIISSLSEILQSAVKVYETPTYNPKLQGTLKHQLAVHADTPD
jgi:hypothetical protein